MSQFKIRNKCKILNLSVDGLDIEPGEARLVPNICLFHLTTSTMMPAPQKVKDLNKTFVFGCKDIDIITNLFSFTPLHVELAGELVEQLFLFIGILRIFCCFCCLDS